MQNAIERLKGLSNQMDLLWNGSVGRGEPSSPPVNLWDAGENFHAEMEVPGFTIRNIDLSFGGNELEIQGKREIQGAEGWTLRLQERPAGEFSRRIQFPAEIDAAKVQAVLQGGVLSITLPKAPTSKPRKIDINHVGNPK